MVKWNEEVKERLIKRLEDLPHLIMKKQQLMLDHSNQISIFDKNMKDIKTGLMRKIAQEKNVEIIEKKDKPSERIEKNKFSNDAAREGELALRIAGNKSYNEARTKWEHNKNLLAKAEIQYKYLLNQFRATLYLIKLMAGVEE